MIDLPAASAALSASCFAPRSPEIVVPSSTLTCLEGSPRSSNSFPRLVDDISGAYWCSRVKRCELIRNDVCVQREIRGEERHSSYSSTPHFAHSEPVKW